MAKHPLTGEMVFFNQVQLHHDSCLPPAVRESLVKLFGKEGLPRQVYYGDGSSIPDSVIAHVGEVYRETATRFPWHEGDLLMLDNMLIAHGRNRFSGPRKVIVAMSEMLSEDRLDAAANGVVERGEINAA